MSKKDSLEGLRSMKSIGQTECKNLVKVPMRSFDGEALYKCMDLVPEEARVSGLGSTPQSDAVLSVKRKPGRPKGTTVKAGAQRPRPKVRLPEGSSAEEKRLACAFSTAEWVKVRRFKKKHLLSDGPVEWRCRCNMDGNHNYLPNWVCEQNAGPKPAKN